MMPVGMWVRRIADSVLLTCWPPAPLARIVSTRTSDSGISILMLSSITGYTSTLANDVWRRALESNGERRTGRGAPPPVDPPLVLEPAIGVAALEADRRRLDAGFFALALLQVLDLVAALLRPAR